MNGVLNLSILDGWWPEGCEHGVNGWAIGDGSNRGDDADLAQVYDLLEGDVLAGVGGSRALGEHDAGEHPHGEHALLLGAHGARIFRAALPAAGGALVTGWPTLALGLVLGMRHAMDPDHVVAVAALTARTRRTWSGAWLGAVWGFGHTITLAGAGAAIILLNLTLPPRVGLAFEFIVAIALVVVGTLNVGRGAGVTVPAPAARVAALRAFGVGLAHGLAGSAAVALLVLATVRDPLLACGYLVLFGAGTIAGMMLISAGFAAPLSSATKRWPSLGPWVRVATGVLSLGFGVWLMVQIGLIDGLFLAHPHWTPR